MSKSIRRITGARCAVPVCLFLLGLLALPARAFTLPAEAGFLPEGTLIPELSSENTRHFSNGDGTLRAEILPGPGPDPAGDRDDTDDLTTLYSHYSGFSEEPWFGVPLKHGPGGTHGGRVHVGYIYLLGYEASKRGWMEWDISSIDPEWTINSVRLEIRYNNTNYGTPAWVQTRGMTLRPTTGEAQPLYNNVGSGTLYGQWSMPAPGNWCNWNLLPAAATDLKNARQTRTWFAIGLAGPLTEPNNEAIFDGCNQTSPDNRPRLVVDYTPANQPPTVSAVDPEVGYRLWASVPVAITGTSFTGATGVSFGADVAVDSFRVNSATAITA